jgi:hypothetical protein
MSTGGNVPSQGVTVQEATSAKKRGDRSMGHPNGYVGKGTAGSRLKSAWRKWNSAQGAPKNMVTLKAFAVDVANGVTSMGPGHGIATKEEVMADSKTWLERKGLS